MQMLPNPNEQGDNKRMIIAVVLCALLFMGVEYYRLSNRPIVIAPVAEVTTPQGLAPEALVEKQDALTLPTQPALEPVVPPISKEPLVLENENYRAELNPVGGGVDMLDLKNGINIRGTGAGWFHKGAEQEQYLSLGWLGSDAPNAAAIWQKTNENTLTYTTPNGLTFTRTLTLGEGSYQLVVKDTVENTTPNSFTLQHYVQIVRGFEQLKDEKTNWVNPFGPIALKDDVLEDASYEDIRDAAYSASTEGGWLGFSTQYFLTALVALEGEETVQKIRHATVGGKDVYIASLQKPASILNAGETLTLTRPIYIGPKSDVPLAAVREDLARAINFGWFHAIAEPMHDVLLWLYEHLGNWGFAIIGLTLMLKVLLFPLTYKSFAAMAKMKKLQPEMKALQEKYTGENAPENGREQMAKEMMGLYQKHKVSPVSGCWPMLLQMPIFFAMYKLILVSFELNGAPFILWIHDLSIQDPYYVLPLLMGASMWYQMRLNPQMGDPVQQKVMQWMPVVFTVFFLWFPAGLVLYWLTNNAISILQQYIMLKRSGAL